MSMKVYSFLLTVVLLSALGSCSKNSEGSGGISCDLPSTEVPEEMVGNWVNGYNSATQILDAYSGRYLGNAFQTGKYFHFEENGKNAQFFLMANAGLSGNTATKVIGTVEFLNDDSFIFHACKAHYRGWRNGSLVVDRDATADEVMSQGLTQRYYYSFVTSGNTTYMQIRFDPNSPYGTSFRQVP